MLAISAISALPNPLSETAVSPIRTPLVRSEERRVGKECTG